MMSESLRQQTREHKGHAITLTPSWHFRVDNMGDGQAVFESVNEATAAIDKYVAALEKQKRTTTKLSVPVVDNGGNPVTIRGIHAGTGKALGAGAYEGEFYPTTPWLVALLKEASSLYKRYRALSQIAAKFAIESRVGYGRIAPEKYDDLVAAYLANIAKAQGEADADPRAKASAA